jgi:hypothetical protein
MIELCTLSLIMNLCHLEGSGFIIAVGLTILMTGVIIYYVNARLRAVQSALEKQGSVLTHLINDVRHSIWGVPGELATEEAKAAALEFDAHKHSSVPEDNLITVSDDDSETGDSETEDSETEDSETEDSETDNDDDEKPMVTRALCEIVDAHDPRVVETNIVPAREIEFVELMSDSNIDSGNQDTLIQTLNLGNIDHVTISKLDGDDTLAAIELASEPSEQLADEPSEQLADEPSEQLAGEPSEQLAGEPSDNLDTDIKAMRVNQLRDMVMKRKNVSEDKAKTMKKHELLQLLLDE